MWSGSSSPSMLSTAAVFLPPPCGTAANSGRPLLAPKYPITPAEMMMIGKGTLKKKMAMKAVAARAIMIRLRSARLPTRTTAWMTMASTAAFSPKNSASMTPTLPKAA